jgi:hypothetical protein
MRRKISYVVMAIVLAALAFTHPVVAEAARAITSGDIRNNTIRSKDVRNDNLKSKDLRDNTVRSKDVRDGTLTDADLAAGAGSVAAYARVIAGPAAPSLDNGRTKNVTGVTRISTGVYCVELAAGVSRGVAVIASPEGALGNASAQWTTDCGTNGVQIQTERLTVNPGPPPVLDSNVSNDVSFHLLVP